MKVVRGLTFAWPVMLAVLPSLASAQVVISEIMYNPSGSDSGREWVELYNAGNKDVSMVGGTVKGSWRMFDGSNHTFTDPGGGAGRGALVIPAHGYIIVSNNPSSFIANYPTGSYSVIKSSISLNNMGATISLIDGSGATLDSASYTKGEGASGDGTSLQKTSTGAWIAAEPTPGSANASDAYGAHAQAGSANASSTAKTQAYAPPFVSPQAPVPHAADAGAVSERMAGTISDGASAKDAATPDPGSIVPPTTSTAMTLSRSASAASFASGSWWWISALGLTLLGSLALALSRTKARSEWSIIEDIEE